MKQELYQCHYCKKFMEKIEIQFLQDKTQVCVYCLDNEDKEFIPNEE